MRPDLDFHKFKLILLAERDSIQYRLENELRSFQLSSDAEPDTLDNAARTIEQNEQLRWARHLRNRQVEVEDALHRIETGQFGICTNCGNNIQIDRLEAKPYASLCIECRAKNEHHTLMDDL